MRTALDADPERLDRHEQNFVEKIRRYGWFGTHVGAEGEAPGFGYTTGFWLKFEFPELILFSLRRQVAHDTFWHIYRELEAGKSFAIGKPEDNILKTVRPCCFPCPRRNIQPISDGADGFTGEITFIVFNWSFPIRTDTSLGRMGPPTISGQASRT